ncbi:MAG TPA: VWA domain-containing protein, partial [Pyrinomonadaceae bacterium]|nr:VWA domain-containing protein [Pyrinomonadaceae bacterium]
MKQIFFAGCMAAIASLASYAQQTVPTPPKVDDPVFKISTNLIRVDVTVTDSKGKIVTGLGTADFDLFENGERQKISDFSFVNRSNGGVAIGDSSGSSSTDPNIPAQPLKPAEVRRTIAIVVDDLNLSVASVYYTKQALRTFVDKQMQPNDLVAILRTGGGVGALQQFTSDKRILYAAIDKIHWNSFSEVYAIPPVESDGQDITERTRAENNALGSFISGRRRPNLTTDKAKDYNQSKNQKEFEDGVKAINSLNAMRYVIEGMKELPGRKAMMLFSDGMRIESESTLSRADSVLARLRTIADIAYRASVVVYTFDTRGMQSLDFQASDNTTEMHEKIR